LSILSFCDLCERSFSPHVMIHQLPFRHLPSYCWN
jgi:hypothetical protein